MYKFLLSILLLIPFLSHSQTYDKPGNYGLQYKRIKADSSFKVPILPDTQRRSNLSGNGDIIYVQSPTGTPDTGFWVIDKGGYIKLGSGGSGTIPGLEQVTLVDSSTTTQIQSRRLITGTPDTAIPDTFYFWGDSFTEGYPLEEQDRYVTIVSKALGAVTVNLGVNGSTLEGGEPVGNMIDNYLSTIPVWHEGLYASIAYGFNDVYYNYATFTGANFKVSYQRVLDTFFARGWPISHMFLNTPFYMSPTAYAPFAGNPAATEARHIEFVDSTLSLGAENGIVVADQYRYMADSYNPLMFIYPDSIHFNATGHLKIAELLLSKINKAVEDNGETIVNTGTIISKQYRFADYRISGENYQTVVLDDSGYFALNNTAYAPGDIGLQYVLSNSNSAETGIHLSNYHNDDIISGTSKYASFLSRLSYTNPDSAAIPFLSNNKWTIEDTLPLPIYDVMSIPIFHIEDTGEVRYQGITSNLNVDSTSTGGWFKNAFMMATGGHFGYPGVRVGHYTGLAVHNPVVYDTCDYCYGIKIGGFNADNFNNGTMLYMGGISNHAEGKWGIYIAPTIASKNYLGSSRTMIGLPSDTEIDTTATLQTSTLTTSGLIKSTTDLSSSLTSLSYVQKTYVDVALNSYLPANGITTNVNGLITLPASGGTNGGLKINGALYLQTSDTQSTAGGTLRLGLSSNYIHTSGTRGMFQVFGRFAPTSGTGIFGGYSTFFDINQTGGANGITYGYWASATLTSAADYRAFRASNNSGIAFYNENAGARNILLGETQIGSTTDLGSYILQATGNAIITGTTTLNSTLTLSSIPAYSTGGYSTLVKNTATNNVETVSLPTLASGSYTTTKTNVANVTGSVAYNPNYYRVGSMVTVFGKVDIQPTAAANTQTELIFTLPIASDLTDEADLAGTGASDAGPGYSVRIKADVTNNQASFVFKSETTSMTTYNYQFSYIIK